MFDAVSQAFDLIERHPEIGSPRAGRPEARQLTVRGFPYVVAYRIRTDDICVVAVAHPADVRVTGISQNRPVLLTERELRKEASLGPADRVLLRQQAVLNLRRIEYGAFSARNLHVSVLA